MSQHKLETSTHHCWLRENPWDSLPLGMTVVELVDASGFDDALLSAVDAHNLAHGTRLCCCRHDAQDIAAKGAFLRAGYYVAETSFSLVTSLRQQRPRRTFSFVQAETTLAGALGQLAVEAFRWSRFHEDPTIPKQHADDRYARWIEQLTHEGACQVALDDHGEPLGFFVTQPEDESAQTHNETETRLVSQDEAVKPLEVSASRNQRLLLAALRKESMGLGVFFFSSILATLQPSCDRLSARVSAANIDALNVLCRLGFTMRTCTLDFHKRYPGKEER